MALRVALIRPGFHALDDQFARHMSRQGFDITLFIPKYSVTTSIRPKGYAIETYATLNGKVSKDYPVPYDLFLRLLRGRFDLYNAGEDYLLPTLHVFLSSILSRRPMLLLIDKYREPLKIADLWIYRIFSFLFSNLIWRRARSILCHSKASRAYMQARIPSMYHEKLSFLPIGVDTDIFYTNPNNRLRANTDTLRVLSVGRLVSQKSQDILIRAVVEASKESSVQLTLIGQGPLERELSELIEALEASHVAKIDTHYYSPAELAHIYNDHDIFILTSQIESMGAVIPEAMACGMPVIVSNIGGQVDFVDEGVSGFIVPAGDVDALKNMITHCAANRQELAKMSNNAARSATEKYSNDTLFAEYAALFLQAVST